MKKHTQLPARYKRRHSGAPARYNPRIKPSTGIALFQGNLAQSMKFGAKGHELSGYVQRKVILIDRNGNKQIATEKQFFNSGAKLGRVRVHDDEGDF
jgi:hypothetical protein